MIEVVEVESNNNGRVVVAIHGHNYDVTDRIKDDQAKLNLYGKDYQIKVKKQEASNGISRARRFKKARK